MKGSAMPGVYQVDVATFTINGRDVPATHLSYGPRRTFNDPGASAEEYIQRLRPAHDLRSRAERAIDRRTRATFLPAVKVTA